MRERRREAEEKEPGIQNQKQEPHTKLWGKNAFWNPGGPVLVQNVRGLPWSFRAKLEMPIVPLGGCQVKKSYSKPSAEAENVTRGSSGRVKK